jgi:hypothetical protein
MKNKTSVIVLMAPIFVNVPISMTSLSRLLTPSLQHRKFVNIPTMLKTQFQSKTQESQEFAIRKLYFM